MDDRAREAARSKFSAGNDGGTRSVLRIVAVYAAVASAWIIASDLVSRWFTVDPNLLTTVSVGKGVFFVAVTSALLFFEIRRHFARLREAAESLLLTTARLDAALKGVTETMGKVVEARDPYTQGHQRGVAKVSTLIAEEMGLPPDEVAAIEVAGLVHDVGKLAVPAEILTRPGSLGRIEYELIQEHSQTGHDILEDIDFGWPIADVVLQHHERADGSGYPNGLSGEQILPAARILAVADVLEAMSSHRPYRPALGIDAAITEVTADGGRFDPDVVAACVRLHDAGALESWLHDRLVP